MLVKLISLLLYGAMALIIWDVVTRHLLMEKIFSLILVFVLLAFWLLLNGLEFVPLVILLLYVGAIAVLFLFVVMILNPDFMSLLDQKKQMVSALDQRYVAVSGLLSTLEKSNPANELKIYQQIHQIFQQPIMRADVSDNQRNSDQEGFYYSSFFLGLLAGAFLAMVFFVFNFLNLKFVIGAFGMYKLAQVLPLQHVEQAVSDNLGLLNQLGLNEGAELKFQAIYLSSWFEKSEIVNIGLLMYTKYAVALILIGVMLLVSMMGAIILTLRQSHLIKRQNLSGSQQLRYT